MNRGGFDGFFLNRLNSRLQRTPGPKRIQTSKKFQLKKILVSKNGFEILICERFSRVIFNI